MKNDIAQALRSMPDLEPPADGWRRIAAQYARRKLIRRGGGFAVAASVVAVFIAGYWVLQPTMIDPASQPESGAPATIQPIVVSAPAMSPDVRAANAEVRALQRRSQDMERLLGGLPRRGQVARADLAGAIAELEDRIAAVDYQINRTGLRPIGLNRAGFSEAGTSDLWRRRVEFMDQLVRARYAETGVDGF